MYLSENEKYWYWLASAPKVGLQKVLRIIGDGAELSALFEDPHRIDFKKCGIPAAAQQNLLRRAHRKTIDADSKNFPKKGYGSAHCSVRNIRLCSRRFMRRPRFCT